MNNSKKVVFPVLMALGFSLASCGGGSGSSNSSTQSSGGGESSGSQSSSSSQAGSETSVNVSVDPNIKADISILVPSGNQNETTMIQTAFDNGFALLYPNVTLHINYVSISNYENTIRSQAMAGGLSDIIWTNSPEYLFLIKNKLVEPLDGYISSSEKAGDFDFKKDFKVPYFDMGSYKSDYYVVPRSADSVVTFFNKKLLKEKGVDTTKVKNGWTWDDFLSVCADYRAKVPGDDAYCCDAYLTGWGSVSYPLLRSFGGEVLNEKGEVIIDSDGTRNAIKCIRNIVDKHYVVKAGVSSGTSFETGSTPFCFQSAAISLYDEKAAIHGDVDVVTFPLIKDNDTPKVGGGIAGYSINSKAANKALCWQFLNYLISSEGQALMAEGGLNLAPIREDMNDFTKEKWGEGYPDRNLSAYLENDEYKITEEYLQYTDPAHMNTLQLAFQDFVANATNSRKTIDTVVETAVTDFQDAIED